MNLVIVKSTYRVRLKLKAAIAALEPLPAPVASISRKEDRVDSPNIVRYAKGFSLDKTVGRNSATVG